MAHILLVDDDETFRKMLLMTLRTMGHEVVEAANGTKAWQAYQKAPADLVIMDLIMPEKEGLETIQQFRRNRSTVKILAITGGGRGNAGDLLSVARAFGANAVLMKPFSNAELVTVLKRLLPATE